MKQLLALLCAAWLATPGLAQTPATAAVPPAVAPAVGAPLTQPLPSNRWTAAQAREAFQLADANGDGRLTRAEAQRLAIMPRSFEEADLNKDGMLTLDEYQASFATP
ncbi:EF-hand domain-containing protein [Ramlibacter sp. PS4R-6]|uniref:EF-hand domain-containing protein n=1 Tax=Ramlibacter sp. PS4R-6 TaxID=3133438 RepID=UPI0030A90E97